MSVEIAKWKCKHFLQSLIWLLVKIMMTQLMFGLSFASVLLNQTFLWFCSAKKTFHLKEYWELDPYWQWNKRGNIKLLFPIIRVCAHHFRPQGLADSMGAPWGGWHISGMCSRNWGTHLARRNCSRNFSDLFRGRWTYQDFFICRFENT